MRKLPVKTVSNDTLQSIGLFLSGSDQIWSYLNNGNDFSYLLDFVSDGTNKASYASSFGLADIPSDLLECYRHNLNNIKHLSTRERTGVGLIKEITGREAFLALDPVLLHPKVFWESLAENSIAGHKEDKFDLIYINDNSFRSCSIFEKSLDNVVCIGSFKITDVFSHTFSFKNHEGPIEFISYIKNANCVYTTSFHAVVFSMIFNTPFYVFLTGDAGRDSRLLQILGEFDLLDRAISNKEDCGGGFEPDFTKFNTDWGSRRLECLNFLRQAVGDSDE